MNKALFLDRDGVINEDYGHVYKIEDFHLIPGILDLCKKYQDQGYLIIVISNQAGVAKGLYTAHDLDVIDKYMKEQFLAHDITITDSYYCLHHPDENCSCRKPKPGLILKAKNEHDIDLTSSILIGDKMSDLEAGFNAGINNLYFKKSRYPEEKVPFSYSKIDYKE